MCAGEARPPAAGDGVLRPGDSGGGARGQGRLQVTLSHHADIIMSCAVTLCSPMLTLCCPIKMLSYA